MPGKWLRKAATTATPKVLLIARNIQTTKATRNPRSRRPTSPMSAHTIRVASRYPPALPQINVRSDEFPPACSPKMEPKLYGRTVRPRF